MIPLHLRHQLREPSSASPDTRLFGLSCFYISSCILVHCLSFIPPLIYFTRPIVRYAIHDDRAVFEMVGSGAITWASIRSVSLVTWFTPFIGGLPRFLILTQSFYNVVSTTFFTKGRVGVTPILLYTFHHFPSTLQKTLDCSPCEYENAGRGRKRRMVCSGLRLNWVSAYTQSYQLILIVQ